MSTTSIEQLTAELLDAFETADKIHAGGNNRGIEVKKFIRKALTFIAPAKALEIGGNVITAGKFSNDPTELTAPQRQIGEARFNTTPVVKDYDRIIADRAAKKTADTEFIAAAAALEEEGKEQAVDLENTQGDQSGIKDNSELSAAEPAGKSEVTEDDANVIKVAANDGAVNFEKEYDFDLDEIKSIYLETSVVNLAKMFDATQIDSHAAAAAFVFDQDANSLRKKASALKKHFKGDL